MTRNVAAWFKAIAIAAVGAAMFIMIGIVIAGVSAYLGAMYG